MKAALSPRPSPVRFRLDKASEDEEKEVLPGDPNLRSFFHRRSLHRRSLPHDRKTSLDFQLGMSAGMNDRDSSVDGSGRLAVPKDGGPKREEMPVRVLNGSPSYMHLLDALNAWQLARELSETLGMDAAAAFNGVQPTGAAIGVPLSKAEAVQCQVEDVGNLKELPTAYARARGMERSSGVGDFVALSTTCDMQTAKILNRDVSEGVIAPDFESAALELLCKKKQGAFILLKMDPTYRASEEEQRSVFGLKLRQKYADIPVTPLTLQQNLVSADKELSESARRDLCVATLALKYGAGQTFAYAKAGQIIAIGPAKDASHDGGPSAASTKAANCPDGVVDRVELWWLRQHPRAVRFPFRSTVKRAERAAIVDMFLGATDRADFLRHLDDPAKLFDRDPPKLLTDDDRSAWLAKLKEVALSSDAWYPFPAEAERLLGPGVEWVASSGAQPSDDALKDLCQAKGVALTHTGLTSHNH